MTITTASDARKNLFPLIEQVNDDRIAVHLTSRKGNAVLISEDDYAALAETAHVSRSAANVRHVLDSLEQARAGQREEHDLLQ